MEDADQKKPFKEVDSRNVASNHKGRSFNGQSFELDGVKFGEEISDDELLHRVCEALNNRLGMDASQIEVDVENGHVELKGVVLSFLDKGLAQRCVSSIPGVKGVTNHLRFE